jgi:glycine/serine hydroxymethyltransferase
VDAVAWTVIGTGVAILIAIASAFRALRHEIREQRGELGKRIDAQGLKISALSEQMHRLEVELRERMAKVEGLLEGLREAISGKRAA